MGADNSRYETYLPQYAFIRCRPVLRFVSLHLLPFNAYCLKMLRFVPPFLTEALAWQPGGLSHVMFLTS